MANVYDALRRAEEERKRRSSDPAVSPPVELSSAPSTEPAATEPLSTEPAATEPLSTEPAATEPPSTEPAATEPLSTEPAATEPLSTEPAATAPSAESESPVESSRAQSTESASAVELFPAPSTESASAVELFPAPSTEPASPAPPSVRVPPAQSKSVSLLERLRRRFGREPSLDTPVGVNKRRISMLQPDSQVAEQFRALRGRLDALRKEQPLRTIAVSSPLAGEGKTTAAINLALVTAMSVGRRVLLVDCDMRRPTVHAALGLLPEAGIAEVLSGGVTLEQAIVRVEGMNLDVLAVRGRPNNPSELLGSPRMRDLMEEMTKRYDRVILDTPAALGVPDAKAVAELTDGFVLIVRADVTVQQDLEATLDLLDRRHLLGLVLNGAHLSVGRYGYTS
ncbi:MAG: polysaccharide biosynthesis tyrosine autokinase [Myxococcota bacterium]|nr:polysaccharide biosynthesis tyrosine autokinase [Myxococcota bacterium]